MARNAIGYTRAAKATVHFGERLERTLLHDNTPHPLATGHTLSQCSERECSQRKLVLTPDLSSASSWLCNSRDEEV